MTTQRHPIERVEGHQQRPIVAKSDHLANHLASGATRDGAASSHADNALQPVAFDKDALNRRDAAKDAIERHPRDFIRQIVDEMPGHRPPPWRWRPWCGRQPCFSRATMARGPLKRGKERREIANRGGKISRG